MKLLVASGKGGAGKTTMSLALAAGLAARGPVGLLDLDVEAPNAHLFLPVAWADQEVASLPVPVVDEEICDRCGICSQACQFKAIAVLGPAVVTFEPMCHGCGACWTLCPRQCISQGRRELGVVRRGLVEGMPQLTLWSGCLRVGEAQSPPLIKAVLAQAPPGLDLVLDAPPGASCPLMTSAGQADAVLLVTEPTPFGLYDLQVTVAALAPLRLPTGVVINRHGLGGAPVEEFCASQGIPVLAKVPYSPEVARAYSQGRRLDQADPPSARALLAAWDQLAQSLGQGAAA